MRFPHFATDNVKILKILTGISLSVMALGTLFTSYVEQIYSETISFKVRDGWCNLKTQGFGAHCFGDFYSPLSNGDFYSPALDTANPNPWNNDLHAAYTPLSFTYFRVINSSLFLDLGSRVPLALNLLLTIASLLAPGIYIWRNQNKFEGISGKWVMLVSLTSAPSLMLIDRGNNTFLLYPAVFFFFLGIQRHSIRLSSYSLIIMGMWKPQTLILSLGVLIFFGLRPLITTILRFGILFSISFFLYPEGLLNNVKWWIRNSMGYQNYAPNPSPGNYSFAGFVGYLDGFKNLAFGEFDNFVDASSPLSPNFVSKFCLFYAIIVVFLFVMTRKSISKFQFILFSSIFMLTIPGTSFGYYLVLMLVPVLLLPKSEIVQALQNKTNGVLWISYLLFLVATVPSWPITWGNLPIQTGEAFSTIGVQWTITHFISSGIVILSLFELSRLAIRRDVQVKDD